MMLRVIKKVFIILLLLNLAGSLYASAEKDSTCYTKEQIDLSSIATYRDSYIPKEYLPLPEWLVFIDMAVLLGIMLAGLFMVVKNKPAKWLSWLAIITLGYLGIIRGGCICPMGLTTNAVMGILSPYNVSLVGLVLFISPVIMALIAGRVFCTSGCPLGAIQHLLYKKKKDYKIPLKINRYIWIAPLVVLCLTVYFAVKGTLFIGCELDPYKPVFFTGKTWFEQGVAYLKGTPMEARYLFSFGIFGWSYFLLTLVAGYWVQRPFCRLLCPYSVILGFVSLLSFRRRKIDDKCTFCTLCVKKCPTQAIVIDRKDKAKSLSNYNCIQCNRCSEACKFDAIKV